MPYKNYKNLKNGEREKKQKKPQQSLYIFFCFSYKGEGLLRTLVLSFFPFCFCLELVVLTCDAQLCCHGYNDVTSIVV